LIKTGERVAPCANRIEQVECRAFTGFQSHFRQSLNVVDFCDHAGSIKVDAAFLHFESHECLIDVAQHLIRNELFLVLGFLFFDERFGALALVAI